MNDIYIYIYIYISADPCLALAYRRGGARDHRRCAAWPLKASKAPEQLSNAFEPQNPLQQLAKASRLLCHGTSGCFYWASKLLRGTFWAPLKSLKARPWNRNPQQLAKASRLLCHGTSLSPTSCFYWASKLLRGAFGHPLKASKAPQQLSKAFEPQNPPQQLAKVSRLLCHGTSP